ncbi:MAG: tetratricopeptide repeat protein [Methylococcaceae bacterium]|nr:tetratricopeptide repeat protein [Methylococcaceae bacterium]
MSAVLGLILLVLTMNGGGGVHAEGVASFVDDRLCGECHTRQFKAWLGSHHQQAMQVATAESVLGDFQQARFTHAGITTRFFRKAGQYFVNTQGADGRYGDFEVKYTFGVEPLQQYLLALPKGRLQAFTVAWDVVQKRWFALNPDEKAKDSLHWSQRLYTWNSACGECHSTDLHLGYDLKTDAYRTTFAAIDVGCQACHGPGGDHLHQARDPARQRDGAKGLAIDYRTQDGRQQVETCARCHARRYSVSEEDAYDHAFTDDFMPELLHAGRYYPDGQIDGEVFEYGSFTQSKMYRQGVRCTDCHDPHTAKPRRSGNALCTACHRDQPPTETFATLPSRDYDTPQHHFHSKGSPGAQCVSCHMPTRIYMQIDARHDHRFPVPRPDLSVKWGTPNACTQCHTDRSADWAAQAMDRWYGDRWRARPSFAGLFATARSGQMGDIAHLQRLADDATQPAIVRATALQLLRPYGMKGSSLGKALGDASPLVRAAAVQGLEGMGEALKLGLPLLRDPSRAVRIEVARVLAPLPPASLEPAQRTALAKVLEEYQSAQRAQADQPEGHFNLGKLYTDLGQLKPAEDAYLTALSRDPKFFPAASHLANLYAQTNRPAEAERVLRRALSAAPEQAELHYALGLLLVERRQLDEAASHLAKAAELLPDQPRIPYNLGLLLQKLGRVKDAEQALLRAYRLTPKDPDILSACALFYRQQRRWAEAETYARQLITLYPDAPAFRRLFHSIQLEKRS